MFQRIGVRTQPNPFSSQGRRLFLVGLTVQWSHLVSKPVVVELGVAVGFQPVSPGWSARPPRLVSGGYGSRRKAC